MTSRPAAPESETPGTDAARSIEGDGLAELLKALSKIQGASTNGDAFGALASYRFSIRKDLLTQLSLAQTEIKGHMRVEDDLQAEVARLRVMVDECHGWLEDARRKAQARIAELEGAGQPACISV